MEKWRRIPHQSKGEKTNRDQRNVEEATSEKTQKEREQKNKKSEI